MKVITFNFTKISAQRKPSLDQIKKIGVNIEFLDVQKEKLEFMKESEALKINFQFYIQYEPDNAKIEMEGVILLALPPEEIKKSKS